MAATEPAPDLLDPRNQSGEAVSLRMRVSCLMHDEGVRVARMVLRHEYPDATDEQIAAKLKSFLHADEYWPAEFFEVHRPGRRFPDPPAPRT